VRGAILIVDDDVRLGRSLRHTLEGEGHDVELFARPRPALARLGERRFDLLLTDLVMPELDGLGFLAEARRVRPDCEVVVMTGFATVETARAALKGGALDYLTKPFDVDAEVRPLVRQVMGASHDPRSRVETLPFEDVREAFGGTAAPHGALGSLLRRLPRIAASGAPVLLAGESGTGKELLAGALHRLSPRRDGPFVQVNGATLAESLAESQLFGATRGAYTGADRDRPGLFEAADGGTLFLDEVAELPAPVQAKLLRVVQDGAVHRLGSWRPVHVDVRLVAASHRDLEVEVEAGRFRKDLFFRLNVIPVRVPPLRERREEIPELAAYLLSRLAGGRRVELERDALDTLRAHAWPGNVRELRNALEHALVLGDGARVRRDDLPEAVRRAPARAQDAGSVEPLARTEARRIVEALEAEGGNRSAAARRLGITRRTLLYRMRKHGIGAAPSPAPPGPTPG
jgi:DNA-binding NtrC family response regulator